MAEGRASSKRVTEALDVGNNHVFGVVRLFFTGILGVHIGSVHTQFHQRPLVMHRERTNLARTGLRMTPPSTTGAGSLGSGVKTARCPLKDRGDLGIANIAQQKRYTPIADHHDR